MEIDIAGLIVMAKASYLSPYNFMYELIENEDIRKEAIALIIRLGLVAKDTRTNPLAPIIKVPVYLEDDTNFSEVSWNFK